MSKKIEDLKHYLSLNYPIELVRDAEQGGFFANHPDLPGCAAQGETAEEAVANLDGARKLWIEARMEDGLPIPLPLTEEPSGKILVRMPRGIHAELAKLAARQGVSLNLLINSILAQHLGGELSTDSLKYLNQLAETLTSTVSLIDEAPWTRQALTCRRLYSVLSDEPNPNRENLIASTISTTTKVSLESLGTEWIAHLVNRRMRK